MKSNCALWLRTIAASVLVFCIAACTKQSSTIPVGEYPAKIVGSWEGSVGGVKETMSINSDGTFVCQTHPMGFIGTKFPQREAGTIRGTWKIKGAIITLHVTSRENEPPQSETASSTIVAFTEAELRLREARGESAKFFRVRMQ